MPDANVNASVSSSDLPTQSAMRWQSKPSQAPERLLAKLKAAAATALLPQGNSKSRRRWLYSSLTPCKLQDSIL